MTTDYRILILGASYGSLLGTRLLVGGHSVTLVCTRDTADLINTEGTTVKFPLREQGISVDVRSADLDATLMARTPEEVDPADYDLVVLAMQEPQYSADGVRQLMQRVAQAKRPCMAIMNMPPLPYLARVPDIDLELVKQCYADPELWIQFEPTLMTLASPDPQAFRPEDEGKNVLHVALPTNFKTAQFDHPDHAQMLSVLETSILSGEIDLPNGDRSSLPVKLKLFDSVYVPLAKWPMLLTGNYRCVQCAGERSIRDAVHGDIKESAAIYQWVVDRCIALGASESDMVPFEKYANAANSLAKPSSVARALRNGMTKIERVDWLVQSIAKSQNAQSTVLDAIVHTVDRRIEANQKPM